MEGTTGATLVQGNRMDEYLPSFFVGSGPAARELVVHTAYYMILVEKSRERKRFNG